VKRALLAIWDFLVGDDWITAAGVVVAGAGVAALQPQSIATWWLIPGGVAALLTRAVARHRGS
jgi:hypothetical protein